jgi:hypothetical protein
LLVTRSNLIGHAMLAIFDLGKNQMIAMPQNQINFSGNAPPSAGN